MVAGHAYAGSYAGRNIGKLYARGGLGGSLGRAALAVFAGDLRHALVVSGFYVLHGFGGHGGGGGIAAGSCETDGPLGVLAVVRALAARGVRASLYAERHNGPVLERAFAAMLAFYDASNPEFAAVLRANARVLPRESAPGGGEDRGALAALTAADLRANVAAAWGADGAVPIDVLFAVERPSEPYGNIRGADISAHTEAVDALWPLGLDLDAGGRAAAARAPDVAALRRAAGVAEDALSFGVGDGGNEVGMANVVWKMPSLAPAGFAPLSANGAYRGCDHLLAATVSNWGGTALEAAAHVLGPKPAVPYVDVDAAVAVEAAILSGIMENDCRAVDGKYHDRPNSVDGLAWDPYHRVFYTDLWTIATAKSTAADR